MEEFLHFNLMFGRFLQSKMQVAKAQLVGAFSGDSIFKDEFENVYTEVLKEKKKEGHTISAQEEDDISAYTQKALRFWKLDIDNLELTLLPATGCFKEEDESTDPVRQKKSYTILKFGTFSIYIDYYENRSAVYRVIDSYSTSVSMR